MLYYSFLYRIEICKKKKKFGENDKSVLFQLNKKKNKDTFTGHGAVSF